NTTAAGSPSRNSRNSRSRNRKGFAGPPAGGGEAADATGFERGKEVTMEERYYHLIFIVRPATPEEDIKKILSVVEHTCAVKGDKRAARRPRRATAPAPAAVAPEQATATN